LQPLPECRMKARVLFLVVVAGAAFLAGCEPTLAPVKGRVTCNGKPVAEAQITFDPVPKNEGDRDAGKPGTGFTDAAGNDRLTTFHAGDGALVGPHRVSVVLDNTNPARCTREKRLTWEVKPGTNQVDIELNQ